MDSPRWLERRLKWLFAGGLLLRLIVLIAASPFNPDRHYEVIQYVATKLSLPVSNQLTQSYHPPLYYVLMAPLERLIPGPTPIHIVSFLLSCANLVMLRRLLNHPLMPRSAAAQVIGFALACFVPQFVMFSSFISNDALALPIGTLIFWAALNYVWQPTRRRLILLAVFVGVGLLTKGTFLATGPALAILVAYTEWRRRGSRAVAPVAGFCALFIAIGFYKYVENTVHFGHPIVHNLDAPGVDQFFIRGVWKGPRTIYDIDVTKLIRRPVLQVRNVFSYPLLFYGTFWYPHVPDSSFRGNVFGYEWVGSILYTLGIVPTIVFLIGLARAIWRTQAAATVALVLLTSNLAVVMAAGIKYDVWWCFQARLCFQSAGPAMVLFIIGMQWCERWRRIRWPLYAICWAAVAACVLYFVVEIALTYGLLARGPALQP